ncbi:hypothetical protein BC937DRAFT_86500 [Endogone sp. FLAS-F59071]|nr:hypothetical protein BC937DRAFT_86500 [Endogone sp. FLAS-F59071]|eukprot:RUS13008.1 hypothetical protein BC937DRAFT_86500 [Endogone sp. FLAS-F59071]
MTSKLIPASLFNATPHAFHLRRYCASSLHLVPRPTLLISPLPRTCFPLLPLHSLPTPPPPSRLFTTTTAPSHRPTPFTPQQSQLPVSTIHATPPPALDFHNPISPSASNPSSIFDFFDKAFPTPRRSYVFSHAATGFPKVGGKKVASPVLSPEEDSKYYSVQVGEDSYFRRYDALGVADGVGGWSGTTGEFHIAYSVFG